MITGELKNKINSIWQDFYNENMAQTSEIVNHLTTLMFIKMLDDKQSSLEARASLIGKQPEQKEFTFKTGIYRNKQNNFSIPYEKLRWKYFKNLNPVDLANTLKNYVIPFIKDPSVTAVSNFSLYAQKYSFGFDGKERLLTSIVDKLSSDDFNFTNIDLMGDVYEYICGSGVSGQYRTPRHIIEMAVKMMKPIIGQKIIDPAMGTAGFIIESAKYIKQNQAAEIMNIQKSIIFSESMFYGCDNDPNMSRIAYMNCVLHGIKKPNISIDSLLENENASSYLGNFDLVLANPPFSGSLVESAINGKILSIVNSSKTELLFVSLMIMLLKNGGRCATIVPDGVLTNDNSSAYINLRSELVEKQKLIAIISMPQGIFHAPAKKGSASKGAGVKTSFLIFQKTNKGGTEKVWFYDMKNDGYTLDLKRTPIPGSQIDDIVHRFNNLNSENNRSRLDDSFFVSLEEIRKKNYQLGIKSYKEFVYEEKKHRQQNEILEDIKELSEVFTTKLIKVINENNDNEE